MRTKAEESPGRIARGHMLLPDGTYREFSVVVPDGVVMEPGQYLSIPGAARRAPQLSLAQVRALNAGRSLLSVPEIARRCGGKRPMARKTVFDWIRDGLPVRRVRGRWVAEDGQVLRWLHAHRPKRAQLFYKSNPVLQEAGLVTWRGASEDERWRLLLHAAIERLGIPLDRRPMAERLEMLVLALVDDGAIDAGMGKSEAVGLIRERAAGSLPAWQFAALRNGKSTLAELVRQDGAEG